MDSALIYSNSYKPKSLNFRFKANAETSHSVRIGPSGGCERYRQW